jgi:hypothetical protein
MGSEVEKALGGVTHFSWSDDNGIAGLQHGISPKALTASPATGSPHNRAFETLDVRVPDGLARLDGLAQDTVWALPQTLLGAESDAVLTGPRTCASCILTKARLSTVV